MKTAGNGWCGAPPSASGGASHASPSHSHRPRANWAMMASQRSPALRRATDILLSGMAACKFIVVHLLLAGLFAAILLIAAGVHVLEAVVLVCDLASRRRGLTRDGANGWSRRLRPVRSPSAAEYAGAACATSRP